MFSNKNKIEKNKEGVSDKAPEGGFKKFIRGVIKLAGLAAIGYGIFALGRHTGVNDQIAKLWTEKAPEGLQKGLKNTVEMVNKSQLSQEARRAMNTVNQNTRGYFAPTVSGAPPVTPAAPISVPRPHGLDTRTPNPAVEGPIPIT